MQSDMQKCHWSLKKSGWKTAKLRLKSILFNGNFTENDSNGSTKSRLFLPPPPSFTARVSETSQFRPSYVLKQDLNPHILHFLCNSKEHLINLPLLSTSFLKWQSIKCWAITIAVLQPVSCWLASQTCRYSFRQMAEAAYLMRINRMGSSRSPCSAYYDFVWVSSCFLTFSTLVWAHENLWAVF